MDATRRTLPLRRVAMMAALAALTVPAGSAEAAKATKAKPPVITSVSPMKVTVGHWLTLRGHNFRRGKHRNSVGFKRDGAAVVFARSDISTEKMLKVKVPLKLEDLLATEGTNRIGTRFHLRVLTTRFGRSFTPDRMSPVVLARPAKVGGGPGTGPVSQPTPVPAAPEGNCDGDDQLNGADPDDDNDLLPDTLENQIGTNGCKADSDGDGVTDGFEYRSAIDLNDDEYSQPQSALPYPGKRPYPNPLDASDVDKDFDGDGLSLREEYGLWHYTTPHPTGNPFADVAGRATPLSYSDGLQYSVSVRCQDASGPSAGLCESGRDEGRRVPALAAADYDKWKDFLASSNLTVEIHTNSYWYDHFNGRHSFDIRDTDLSGGAPEPEELFTLDSDQDGFLSDDERDEDADGLSNYDELKSRMTPQFWGGCYANEPLYPVAFAGTDPTDADSDGDGVRDGADDQDNDDFPNLMELSRFAASGWRLDTINETDDGVPNAVTRSRVDVCKPDPDLKADAPAHRDEYGQVNPFNPCLPDPGARSCADKVILGQDKWAPFGGPHWWALN